MIGSLRIVARWRNREIPVSLRENLGSIPPGKTLVGARLATFLGLFFFQHGLEQALGFLSRQTV